MTKIKYPTRKLKFFYYALIIFAVLFGLSAILNLIVSNYGLAALTGLACILFIASAIQRSRYVKKAKNKKFIEFDVNAKKMIKTRITLGIVFLIAGIVLFFTPYSKWAVFVVFLGLLMFWRIYQLKRLMRK